MRGLVLAAGLGTRIRSVAGDRPKALVPVAGRPVIDRVLDWLRDHGVEALAVNLHHGAQVLAGHLADRPGIRLSHEPELLGTAGATVPLADFLSDTFVVAYGDVLTDLDLVSLVAFHRQRRADLTMALYRVPNPSACGIVALDPDGRVTQMVEKPDPDEVFSDLANAGVIVVEPSVIDRIRREQWRDFGHDVVPGLLATGASVYGWPVPDGVTVIDMGTEAGYARAESWLRGSEREVET